MPIVIVTVALIGLAIGSFLNVVVYRVPVGASVVSPPSSCPSCDQPIRTRHNLPVLGWLILRGRCADCRTRISPRYPLVELATAVAFVAVTLRAISLHELAMLPALLYFTSIGIALSLIDLESHRLPNAIVLPSYPVLAALLGAAAVAQDDRSALLRAVIGGAALFGGYFLLAFSYPAGMGFGDVKLAGLVGAVLAYLSYSALLVGAFGAFLLGGVVGVLVLLRGKGSRKTPLPFGPFMILAALIAVFAAPPLLSAYRSLTGI
jgi:leader peptidase (prepilin peptidase) / N-methyltransferase